MSGTAREEKVQRGGNLGMLGGSWNIGVVGIITERVKWPSGYLVQMGESEGGGWLKVVFV